MWRWREERSAKRNILGREHEAEKKRERKEEEEKASFEVLSRPPAEGRHTPGLPRIPPGNAPRDGAGGGGAMLMTHGVLCVYCGQPVEDWRRWTEVCQRCEDEMMEEGDD